MNKKQIQKFILAIDQGTTGTTAVLYNKKGTIEKKAYKEFKQIYPRPGWVEHNPMEIWKTVRDTVNELLAGINGEVISVGITNQRETTVMWDKKTGKPVYNAIVWQCRRTQKECERLKKHKSLFWEKTGLPVDAYFSGTKIKWILDNVKGLKRDNLLFGTIDTWLIWKLTNGKVHATDYTNASRTLLFNIKSKKWDTKLCKILKIPQNILPEVKNSIDDYGVVSSIGKLKNVPIYGVAGDQQASLFGHTCFNLGQIKNTYGTGCFIMMNTASKFVLSKKGLITTLAVSSNGKPCYALEGSVFIAGASIQWLRDELKIIANSKESEKIAKKLKNNEGVYLVPAFVGLGAPHWDMEARGILTGLTRGSGKNHIVRAALESMAYQTHDILSVMNKETRTKIKTLAVDGGACANNFLMKFQADIINIPVLRPKVIESTSLGVAYMAGLKAGMWKNSKEIEKLKSLDRKFIPSMENTKRKNLLEGWNKALRQAMTK